MKPFQRAHNANAWIIEAIECLIRSLASRGERRKAYLKHAIQSLNNVDFIRHLPKEPNS